MINGIINIYKEAGFTSFDVVAKLRGICKQKKIGHTGTLDPDAVGVLPVCLGKATKICDILTDTDKTYETTFVLGITTDTQDMSGEVLQTREVDITPKQAEEAILSFVGAYSQIPPMYSAKKVNGKKLYELARAGVIVERRPCEVVIHKISIKEISLPHITMEVSCSKGTYIRTLCHDIGEKLLCGAAMETLKRTKAGAFEIADSLTLAQVEELAKEDAIETHCRAIDDMFPEYPHVYVAEEFQKLIYNGNSFYPNQAARIEGDDIQNSKVCVYDAANQFIGIYEYKTAEKKFCPFKIFLGE